MKIIIETFTLFLFVASLFVGYILKPGSHDSLGLIMFVTALCLCVFSILWNPRARSPVSKG